MNQAERALYQWIAQLGIELGDLRSKQQALVNDGAAGERRDVEVAVAFDFGVRNLVFNPAASHIELAFEIGFRQGLQGLEEDLLDVGLRAARYAADGGAVDRRIAPAHHLESLFADDLFDYAFTLQALQLADGQKNHSNRVAAGLGQSHAQGCTLARKELMRNLNQHARAVACFGIATASSAVLQVREHLDSLFHDGVALFAANTGDETEAACIMLVGRIVETLGWRQSAGVPLLVILVVQFHVVSHCSPVCGHPLD